MHATRQSAMVGSSTMGHILARSAVTSSTSTTVAGSSQAAPGPSSASPRHALSYLPRSSSSSSFSTSMKARHARRQQYHHHHHHHPSSLNLCVSAARSTSVHPSSLLSVWSPSSSSSSSFSTSATSGASAAASPSYRSTASTSATAVSSPTFLSHRLAATDLTSSSSPATTATPSAMQLDYITTTSNNSNYNKDSTNSAPWIPSSPLLGLPGFVGPISACPSPVMGSGGSAGSAVGAGAGARTIPLPPSQHSSSSYSSSFSSASSDASSTSPSPGVSASPLPAQSSSGRLHSNPLRPTIGGRSPQRRHRHLFSPISTSSLSTSPPSMSGLGIGGPSTSNHQQRRNASSGSSRKPSAADDPYPLPFSVELDPSQQGPSAQPLEPVRVSPEQLEQGSATGATGTTGADFDADQHNIDLATTSQNDGFDLASTPLRVPGREDEDRETKIARLIYQTRKRGTLETDLILSTFAKRELGKMSSEEVDEFDRLLDEPDWDIFYWCTARKAPADRWADSFNTPGRLGHRLRIHTKNEEKVVRWMPQLDVKDRQQGP